MIRKDLREAIDGARQISKVEEIYGLGEGLGIVRADTVDDLGRLLVEVGTELQFDPRWAQSTRIHESQHARAARILDASEINFLVKFARVSSATNPDGGLCVGVATNVQFITPQRPLVNALISAYPGRPSDSDQSYVQRLGYQDVDHVVHVAKQLNKYDGGDFPIPSWARGDDWTPDQTRDPRFAPVI